MRVFSKEDDFEKQETFEGGEASPPSSKSWLSYSFAAMLAFTINNSAMCEVTEKAGAECLQYFATGFIISFMVYNLYEKYRTGKWTDQNIIVDNKFSYKNFNGFLHYFTSFFLIQFTAFGTFYLSQRAGLNVGISTIIWRVNVFVLAFADYVINGQKLMYYHHIGLLFITICTVLVSLEGLIDSKPAEAQQKKTMPMWAPILFCAAFPIATTYNSLVTKWVTSAEMGFDASTVTFTTHGVMNILILCFGIPYWLKNDNFDPYLFKVGVSGGVLNCLGLVCLQNAFARGPLGPALAIVALSSILFVIQQAIIHQKPLTGVQLVAAALGTYGAFIMVIPEYFEKYCCPCWCKKRGSDEEYKKEGEGPVVE